MKKIGELHTKKHWYIVLYNEADKQNPYRLYRKWYSNGWHKNLICKYADLASVTTQINDYVLLNDEF